MGLDVWAPKRDRGRAWKSMSIGDIPRLRDRLPTQFDRETNRTIEEIDVLWLSGQMIAAAFEVEHSTSIFGPVPFSSPGNFCEPPGCHIYITIRGMAELGGGGRAASASVTVNPCIAAARFFCRSASQIACS